MPLPLAPRTHNAWPEDTANETPSKTGIAPRTPQIPGIDHPKVLSYIDVLLKGAAVGDTVAVIGAGGIGFDVSEFLVHEGESPALNTEAWFKEWGVDIEVKQRGGLDPQAKQPHPPARKVYLMQRKDEALGKNLGKTSGWVHRATLKDKKVTMVGGVSYDKIDDAGLHITVNQEPRVIDCDNVIICAGQEPLRELQAGVEALGKPVHLVGGADVASELDAKRAIKQASELAAKI